uniref:Spc7 domain-containing protein n=1 Tax=Strongyloides papillosus TaxID=174720 RepID=A0A0N5CCX2_STREA
MSNRINSILKQANDGSNNSFETPKNIIKRRRVSFSRKRVVQHFDKTDLNVHFGTVMEEIDYSESSESQTSTPKLMFNSRPKTVYVTPDVQTPMRLNTTSDVFSASPGNISIASNRSFNTPIMSATRSTFGSNGNSTQRNENLSDSENSDDMDVSFARTPKRPSAEISTPKSMNMAVMSPEGLRFEKENNFLMEEDNFLLSEDIFNTHQPSNGVKSLSSYKILPNSYIYRNSPLNFPRKFGSGIMDISNNSTPFRRRSLNSPKSYRINNLRRSLPDDLSYSVEGVSTSPGRENISNTIDIDEIGESSSSQSFIKLSSPVRPSKISKFAPSSPVVNDFVNDNSLVNAPALEGNLKENEMEVDQLHTSSSDRDQHFLNESYDFVYEDILNVNSSIDEISRNSATLKNMSQNSTNDAKTVSTSENAILPENPENTNEDTCDAMDSHSDLLPEKRSEKAVPQEDQSTTLDNIPTINFDKSRRSKDKSIVEKPSETLYTIVEEEENQALDKTIDINDVMARSGELKNVYAYQLNLLKSIDTVNQDHGSDIFNDTSGFSTDVDMSMWNKSDSTTCSSIVDDESEILETPALTDTDDSETDVKNSCITRDVTMRTVDTSFSSCEFYDVTRVSEGLDFINPITFVTYNDNYKECDDNYKLRLAISFIQSILYNESLRRPMLRDFVHGFEKSAILKNFMIKTEAPIDLDDLYNRVLDLKDIGEIIDDFRRINFDVYKTEADQLEMFFDTIYEMYLLLLDHLSVEMFFDTIYEMYLLLLDHLSVYRQKQMKYNDNVYCECFKIINEMNGIKQLHDEERKSLSELLNCI